MSEKLDLRTKNELEMIRRMKKEISLINDGDNKNRQGHREMLRGLTRGLTDSFKHTSSMAGGYIKVGASAVAQGADVMARNV